MNRQIIINVVKYDVRDKLESDNIRFRCHIMHNPCKAKTSIHRNIIKYNCPHVYPWIFTD